MKTQLVALQDKTISAISESESVQELDDVKIQVLGKKGQLTDLLKGLKSLPPEERPSIGKLVNSLKEHISSKIEIKRQELQEKEWNHQLQQDTIDTSLPEQGRRLGSAHPLQHVLTLSVDIFKRLGFSVKEGPDIETDHYNFEALNIPADHPARDMHDTFYLTDGHVLRTHTSPVQIRTLENTKSPVKFIVPGQGYRFDADVSHSPVFHQIEGLYVDKQVSFSDLKGTLEFFLQSVFGKHKKVRFRPSFFPFTEPSTEVDVQCVNCNAKGCSVCKQTGWVEILGAGMVHRNVLRAVNVDPDTYTGFAFGLGIERIAMLMYNIPDIRLFYENDSRFLRQFT